MAAAVAAAAAVKILEEGVVHMLDDHMHMLHMVVAAGKVDT